MTEELLEEQEPPANYAWLLSRSILVKYGGKTNKEAIKILDEIKGMKYTFE